jgi:hypothetical protein
MLSEEVMKIRLVKYSLLVALTAIIYSAIAQQTEAIPKPSQAEPEAEKSSSPAPAKKAYEPAIRFTPSEKLRADDAISFPVDI